MWDKMEYLFWITFNEVHHQVDILSLHQGVDQIEIYKLSFVAMKS